MSPTSSKPVRPLAMDAAPRNFGYACRDSLATGFRFFTWIAMSAQIGIVGVDAIE